jgi:hypothetical protein
MVGYFLFGLVVGIVLGAMVCFAVMVRRLLLPRIPD